MALGRGGVGRRRDKGHLVGLGSWCNRRFGRGRVNFSRFHGLLIDITEATSIECDGSIVGNGPHAIDHESVQDLSLPRNMNSSRESILTLTETSRMRPLEEDVLGIHKAGWVREWNFGGVPDQRLQLR